MKVSKLAGWATGLALVALATTADADPFGGRNNGTNFEGAVYAMANGFNGNSIVAYGRRADGTLKLLGEYATGGDGAAFDGGEGLDPLISAYAILLTENRRHLLVVNAGSSSVSVFRVRDDLSLRLTDTAYVQGVGPNSIAYRDGLVYVSTIDADGVFAGEPDQEGALSGFRLTPGGRLRPIRNSVRYLDNRPSAVQFSPDGRFLVVSSINAGSAALASGSTDEIVVYGVGRNGRLTGRPLDGATSTLPFNAENRNLPSAIGFEIVEDEGEQFVVVTEAREFQADGTPPAFPALQAGSVSTWRLEKHGQLTPINLDVLTGTSQSDGERTTCWIEFSADGNTFWVSNALEATLSTFSFYRGEIDLLERAEVSGIPASDDDPFGTTDGWIDLWISDDGEYVYQLYGLSGTIGVFKVDDEGTGTGLTLIQEVSDLPEINTQGIVAF
ncbi:MAG: beta-propeller fold lactonase family protein [Pseudomonadota bacterium]